MSFGMPKMPERSVIDGVALVADRTPVAAGATFCFTERTGGVSLIPYASLNLGGACGDDPANVAENRRRAFAALGCGDLLADVAVPRQVHGDAVVVIDSRDADVSAGLDAGCDSVVCTVPDRAVMLLFADCAPVVLTAPGGFAVAHSGWRGTLAGIAGTSARALAAATGCRLDEVNAVIGPHIGARAYEVSADLLGRFVDRFGQAARGIGERRLDLEACICASLAEAGCDPDRVLDCGLCTATLTDRFFSHRAEHGMTGRHAAIAFMRA